ncbi:hypothetical protein PENTCL1PPCAC_4678 [Pristionchus entomophagus]|uniref:Uncharacterized protein n=1 Tax=Pristionchus entomophagus TaxID=358040 RepID=A0AAV5SHG5_9BILA|nr:hypothetical protein PENTCL1PPCAC_4678 [Pristionchus entomophagus]
MKIKTKIVEETGRTQATIYINTSYLSTFTYVDGVFRATEIPSSSVSLAHLHHIYISTTCNAIRGPLHSCTTIPWIVS